MPPPILADSVAAAGFDNGDVPGVLVSMLRVGLISDTHGLLRPEASAFLRGCSHIVHGGDIGTPDVLQALAAIAPMTAVRGNNDKGSWAEALPETELVYFEQVFVYVIHDLAQLDIEPSIRERRGVLYVNPGSAGPRRFRLPVAVAELDIAGKSVTSRIVQLADRSGG